MNRLIYHIIAFLVVAVWGTTFVYTKLLLMAGLTAAQIFVLRFIIAYVMLLVYSLTRKHFRWFSRVWQDELLMVGLGITGGSLYFLTENSAMIYTTTTNTSLIVCMCPLFAALLVSLFFRAQRLHGLQIVGTVMSAIGVAAVVLNGHFVLHLSPLGDTLAFAACLCWAVYSHDSILHGLSGPALAQLGVPYRCATEPAFPRLHGLDVMFLGMELGCKEVGGDSGHELCVFQPRDHGAVCLAYLVGAYHGVFPDGYGAHSDGFVFL